MFEGKTDELRKINELEHNKLDTIDKCKANNAFLIRLSDESNKPKPNHLKEAIQIVYRKYRIDDLSKLLLSMDDDERKKVMKHLGCEYKMNTLLYVYNSLIWNSRNTYVKMIFDSIEGDVDEYLFTDTIERYVDNRDLFNFLLGLLNTLSGPKIIAEKMLNVNEVNRFKMLLHIILKVFECKQMIDVMNNLIIVKLECNDMTKILSSKNSDVDIIRNTDSDVDSNTGKKMWMLLGILVRIVIQIEIQIL